jgi:hypothetical protein
MASQTLHWTIKETDEDENVQEPLTVEEINLCREAFERFDR